MGEIYNYDSEGQNRYLTYTSGSVAVNATISDSVPGPGGCSHSKPQTHGNGVAWKRFYPNGKLFQDLIHTNECQPLTYGDGGALAFARQAARGLNRSKLPTSSKFGIIQFVAELDETIASFGKRITEQLSYGNITWGILPFVSDIQAMLEALLNLYANLETISYEDTGKINKGGFLDLNAYSMNSVKGTFRNKGVASIPGGNDILALYDRLGFHPDIATAWDLVPLSFLVDYLLPIGTTLESLHERGWVRLVSFEGWSSIDVTVEAKTHTVGDYIGQGLTSSSHHYERWYSQTSLDLDVPAQDPQTPSLGSLSFQEAFNMLYIGSSRLF